MSSPDSAGRRRYRKALVPPLLMPYSRIRSLAQRAGSATATAPRATCHESQTDTYRRAPHRVMVVFELAVGDDKTMCRNIKTLFNFEPPVTREEVRAASLQFVRKISGFTTPSK